MNDVDLSPSDDEFWRGVTISHDDTVLRVYRSGQNEPGIIHPQSQSVDAYLRKRLESLPADIRSTVRVHERPEPYGADPGEWWV